MAEPLGESEGATTMGMASLLVTVLVTLLACAGISSWIYWRRLRDGPTGHGANVAEPSGLRVSSLSPLGPRQKGARLELYGTPVRVRVLVLAPLGRTAEIPARERFPELVEQWLPGAMQVLGADQPAFNFWPDQLSARGFSQAFFNQLALPGHRGKGTRWCGVAGRFEAWGATFVAGLVCEAATDNGLGQIELRHPGQWLDAFRIRQVEPR